MANFKVYDGATLRMVLGQDADLNAGDLIYAAVNGDKFYTTLPAGTDAYVLTMSSGLPSWMPSGSGGIPSPSATGQLIYTNTPTTYTLLTAGADGQFLSLSSGIPYWVSSAILPAPGSAGDMLYSSSGSTWDILGISSDTYVLTVSSGEPTWVPQRVPAEVADGDLLYGNSSSWNILSAGTSGQYFQMVGTLPAWVSGINTVGGYTYFYNYSNDTNPADIVSGQIAFDNASIPSATTFYVSDVDAQGETHSLFDAQVKVGDKVMIFNLNPLAGRSVTYAEITSVDFTGPYNTFGITISTSFSTSWTNGDPIGIGWVEKGDNGNDGATGPQGAVGGWTIEYEFNTVTSGNPSSGHIRYNDLVTVTNVYISTLDTYGNDVTDLIGQFKVNDQLKIFCKADASIYVIYTITALNGNTGSPAYGDFSIVSTAAFGTLTNNMPIGVSWESVEVPHALLDGAVNDDTLASSPVRGGIIVANATPKWAQLAIGANLTVLASDGTDASWTAISSIVPTHTLLNSTYFTDVLTGSVARGSVIVGNSTPKWSALAIGANLTVLASDGTDASWTAISSLVPTHTLLNSTYFTDVLTGSVARGSIIYGNSTPKWATLAIGAANTFLKSNGTDISWSASIPTMIFNEALSPSPNGVITAFTISATPSASTDILVFRNGVNQRQGGGNDYTISGSTITFNTAPITGDILLATYATTSSSNFVFNETPSGTINGINLSFSLANSPSPTTSLLLFRDGLLCQQGNDYTLSGSTISFVSTASTPPTGGSLNCAYTY